MSKKNDTTTTIVAGKQIHITSDSREDAANQVEDLRKQAKESGLVYGSGGFIGYNDGVFSTDITFIDN